MTRPLLSAEEDAPRAASTLDLRVEEVRGTSVVLRGRAPKDSCDPSGLALERAAPGKEGFATLSTIALTAAQREQWCGDEGLSWIDAPPSAGTWRYRLRAGPDATATSNTASIDPGTPPPAPQAATASFVPGRGTLLQWEPVEGGVMIFKRSIEPPDAVARLATLPQGKDGVYLDHTVSPGQVVAYRLVRFTLWHGVPRFGPPGPEVYASAPRP